MRPLAASTSEAACRSPGLFFSRESLVVHQRVGTAVRAGLRHGLLGQRGQSRKVTALT
jgi:hypothetical protein